MQKHLIRFFLSSEKKVNGDNSNNKTYADAKNKLVNIDPAPSKSPAFMIAPIKIIGRLKIKEKLAASLLEMLIIRIIDKVAPLRLTPGKIAMAWNSPIKALL